jgi:hypothetical protein
MAKAGSKAAKSRYEKFRKGLKKFKQARLVVPKNKKK